MRLTLTTNHAASSYGIPVLVDESGIAYGPSDVLPSGELASGLVQRRLEGKLKADEAGNYPENFEVDDPDIDYTGVLAEKNSRYERLFLGQRNCAEN